MKYHENRSHERIREDLYVRSRTFAARRARSRESQSCLDVMFYLETAESEADSGHNNPRWFVERLHFTFVTVVPPKKKTTRSAKKTLQGCIAWTVAVAAAVAIPMGVKDSRDQAR